MSDYYSLRLQFEQGFHILHMNSSETTFKTQLMHLRQQLSVYLKKNNVKKVPIKKAVAMVQKHFQMEPKIMLNWFKKSLEAEEDFMSLDNILECISSEIMLKDQAIKVASNKASIIDVTYHREPDSEFEGQKLQNLISEIKKKETNIIRTVETAQILKYQLLIVALNHELLFYDCRGGNKEAQGKEIGILNRISFKYCNIKNKIITNHNKEARNSQRKETRNCQSREAGKRNANSREDGNHPSNWRQTEYADQIVQNSPRTQDLVFSNKNTSNSNSNVNLIKKGRQQSAMHSEASNRLPKRQLTDSYSLQSSLNRNKASRERCNVSSKQNKRSSSKMVKIKTNDKKTAFRIISEASTDNAIEFIKAYRISQQGFQKYVAIEKSKIEKEASQNFKAPYETEIRQNFSVELKKMQQQSHDFSTHKREIEKSLPMSFAMNPHRGIKPKCRRAPTPQIRCYQPKVSKEFKKQEPDSDACKALQQKMLKIQSFCFRQEYLLVSLINREVRLYKFRQRIYGFREELIFETSFDSIVSYVLLYKSIARKLYNMVVAKLLTRKESEIRIYQLGQSMQMQMQCFRVSVDYAPIYQHVEGLGMLGHVEIGYFFLLEFESVGKSQKQSITIERCLVNPQNGDKLSISSVKMHKNLMKLYFGAKNGCIYIYDRFTDIISHYKRVTKFALKYIDFIEGYDQIMFYDEHGKIGIVNGLTLAVQTFIMTGNTTIHTIVPFFIKSFYLLFSDRAVALAELNQNQEKQFSVEKVMKIYNRRMRIETCHEKPQQLEEQSIPLHSIKQDYHKKFIKQCYITDRSIIMVCSDCEIVIYNQKLEYIGSYFTVGIETIVQCTLCSLEKHLGILHDNNQIEIVSYYIQSVVTHQSIKEQVEEIFFCDSSIYFYGYLTENKVVHIIGHPNLKVLKNQPNFQKNAIRLSDYLNLNECPEYQISFYNGHMMFADMRNGQIICFNKKTFTRSHCFKCWEHESIKDRHEGREGILILTRQKQQRNFPQQTGSREGQRQIIEIKNCASQILSVLRADGVVILYSLPKKTMIAKLDCLKAIDVNKNSVNQLVYQPWLHSFNIFNGNLIVIWIIKSMPKSQKILSLSYSVYSVKEFQANRNNSSSMTGPSPNQTPDGQLKFVKSVRIWSQTLENMPAVEFTNKKFALLSQNLVFFNSRKESSNFIGLYGPDIEKPNSVIIDTQSL